ncbi:MAG TPA: MaoC/PaaZ C-terminal domain-containing protein [Amycolatopsis sp.]|nr:MaoC/PaaZ C-terminal domain-containing protein [Amycolatopsis sp.]
MTGLPAEGLYDALEIGFAFSRRLSLTETHLLLGNMLFADSVPLHTDEQTSAESAYGRRIMPGPVVAGVAAVTLGMSLQGAAIGYLEQRESFKAPIHPGDTVTVTWTVTEKVPKERFHGGIVTFSGRCVNQDDVLTLECLGVAIITNRPPGKGKLT